MSKKNISSLEQLYKTIDTSSQVGDKLIPMLADFVIDFSITFPLDLSRANKLNRYLDQNSLVIKNCDFKQSILFNNDAKNYYFNNCTFDLINADDKTFSGKMRFHSCTFNKKLRLNNTVFKDLVDFWASTFIGKVIFYKVDFEKTTVFSISTFKDNVLFTYAKISEQAIFRGTTIEKGIDFSLAIIEGNLAIFDFTISDFPTKNGKLYKKQYESLVSEDGEIPQKNKRETFRIIKKQLADQKNTFDATKFSFLESKTFRKEVWNRIFPPIISKETKTKWKGQRDINNLNWLQQFKRWLDAWINYVILFLNRWSNRHGTSYAFGIVFTLIIGALFYYLSVTNTTKYDIDYVFDWSIVKENVAGYVQFLIPTHRFTYLDNFMEGYKLNPGFYIWDILGRIFIGYGIYQTIQAFRKYK